MRREKRIDIEIMRILAAFFVIFNHTGIQGFFFFSLYDKNSPHFWVYLFVSVFCKFSVPLFFMISGAMLLNKESSYENVWKKRVSHMALILLVWSVFYYLVEVYRGNAALSPRVFLKTFLGSGWNVSFWYLYAYITFLMSVPLLQKIAKAISNKEYVYMYILVSLFGAVIPIGEFLVWKGSFSINSSFDISWLTEYIFLYPLIGYFLFHRVSDFWTKKKLGLLWVVNILTIVISCYLTYRRACITGEVSEAKSQVFHNTFAYVNATTIFVTCQYFFRNRKLPEFLRRMVESMGSATFGIYLVHIFLMTVFSGLHVMDVVYNTFRMNKMIISWLYCGCVFGVGYLLTMILKRIPFVKSLVS